MASCPKCGAKVKYKRRSDGFRHCKRHGVIEKLNLEAELLAAIEQKHEPIKDTQ